MSDQNENVPEEEPHPEEIEAPVAEEVVIDPSGPPRPARRLKGKKQTTGKNVAVALGLGAAGFAAFLVLTPVVTPGATRSSRLEIERREAEIDRAIAEAAKTAAPSAGESEDGSK